MAKEYTSNSLQKLVTKLMDKKRRILNEINSSVTFTAAISEDLETLKAENKLDIEAYVTKIDFINDTILKIKHAKNVFNTTYVMPINGLTIDEAIVELAMLNEEKSLLGRMNDYKTKERASRMGSKEPEYTYTTFDKEYTKKMYDEVFDKIQSLQEELNDINSTVMFELELDEDEINSL